MKKSLGAFEITTISEDRTIQIKNSIKRILSQIDFDVKAIMERAEFFVLDNQSMLQIYPNQLPLIESNVLGSKATIKDRNVLLFNMDNISDLNLDEEELAGLISHELGHIFNCYKSDVSRSIQIMYPERYLEIPKNCEFYADYFSNMTNCKAGLISLIEKSLLSEMFDEGAIALFRERLEKLRNNEVFIAN